MTIVDSVGLKSLALKWWRMSGRLTFSSSWKCALAPA